MHKPWLGLDPCSRAGAPGPWCLLGVSEFIAHLWDGAGLGGILEA